MLHSALAINEVGDEARKHVTLCLKSIIVFFLI